MRFYKDNAVEFIQVQAELAIAFPGTTAIEPIIKAFDIGRIAMLSDVVSEVIGLGESNIERFLIVGIS